MTTTWLIQSQSKFTTSYSYDGLDELLDLNQVSGTTSLAHFYNTAYDGAGNNLGYNASALGPLNQTSRLNYATFSRQWSYDNRDELTNEHIAANGYLFYYTANHNYVADAADNLTTIRSTVFDTVNADNQSVNLSQHYDGNGNPTDFMVYDVNDRLINVSLSGKNLLSSYRSDGLRASKMLTGNSPTYFLYDGTRVLCELDASGNVLAAYGYGGAGLAQRYSGAMYTAYTFDPMGNVVGRLRQYDAPTVPFDMSAYDAFGMRRDYVSGAGLQNLSVPPDSVGYGGQLGNYTDVEANLVLMGYRFYSPMFCRFLTRDPSGYEGGINLYAYCRNNPINRFDPLGLDKIDDAKNLLEALGIYFGVYHEKTFTIEYSKGKLSIKPYTAPPHDNPYLDDMIIMGMPAFSRHGTDLEVDLAAWLARSGIGRKAAKVITKESLLTVKNISGNISFIYDGKVGKTVYEVKTILSTTTAKIARDKDQFLKQAIYAKSKGMAYRVFYKGPISQQWIDFGKDHGIIFVPIPGPVP